MRWQRVAQLALLAIVVVFVVAVTASLRKQKTATAPEDPPPPPPVKGSELYNPTGATFKRFDGERKVFEAVIGPHTKFPDGRLTVTGGARVLTNRDGKDLVIVS